jgi:hypothetical protein
MSCLTILGGGEVDQRYATIYAMCMFLCFLNLSRLFFTLDRLGQQADRNIAPGVMFFMFFRFQGLPAYRNGWGIRAIGA